MLTAAKYAFQAPNAGSMVPQIDPTVSAALDRAKAQLAALPNVLIPNKPAEAQPQNQPQAGDLRWQNNGSPGSAQGGNPGGGQGNGQAGNDNYASMGFASNVPRSLISTESGGNWGARNNERGSGGVNGHYGILQFGNARFQDAVNAGVIPQGMTIDQFGSDTPEGRAAQVAASNWHFSDIDHRITAAGYDKLVGQTIGGVNMSWDGMRSMAHLGGFGSLSNFIKTNGGYNPSDSLGTSLAAYGQSH